MPAWHWRSTDRTLQRIQSQVAIRQDRVAVLLALPLTRKTARRQLKRPALNGIWPFGRARHEYIHSDRTSRGCLASPMDEYVDDYMERIARPVLARACELRKRTSAEIIPEAKFRALRQKVRDSRYHALFLIAHHSLPKGEPGAAADGSIELVDGLRPCQELVDMVRSADRDFPLSLVLLLCSGEGVAKHLYLTTEATGPLAFASWRLLPADCVSLATKWIECLNGTRTLAGALDEAIARLAQGDVQCRNRE